MRYRVEFAIVRMVQACLQLMPMTAVRACGGALGWIVSVVDLFHRRSIRIPTAEQPTY